LPELQEIWPVTVTGALGFGELGAGADVCGVECGEDSGGFSGVLPGFAAPL
jgi:hypothetical protein